MAEARYQDLSADDRRDALQVVEHGSNHKAHLLEKDIWVVATLNALFDGPFAQHLTFKGGTSLSKVWRAIRRFSEDVDITYDIRAFAPDLVSGAGDEALPPTRSQEKRWTRAIRPRLTEWVRNQAYPVVEARLARAGFTAALRVDGDRLYIGYEPLFEETGLVRPEVMVEFGARSTGEPHEIRPVVCDAAAHLPDLAFPAASPAVMLAEQTFWEKATAIHVFCRQERRRGERLSRGTGTISHVLMKPASRYVRWLTANLRFRWPATRRCSSRRTTQPANGSTTWQQSWAACSSFPSGQHMRCSPTTT